MTVAEQRTLLRVARDSIRAALQRTHPPRLTTPSPRLSFRSGVFVSLHVRLDLRGCIGTLTADRALHENVARLAVAAAFNDPRFAPLSEHDLPATDIEISRLTTPTPTTVDEIVIGRDGVCVVSGTRRGLLLPQVAREHRWSRERLLTEVCRKADLSPDAWQQMDVELLRFEAEIFSDRLVGE